MRSRYHSEIHARNVIDELLKRSWEPIYWRFTNSKVTKPSVSTHSNLTKIVVYQAVDLDTYMGGTLPCYLPSFRIHESEADLWPDDQNASADAFPLKCPNKLFCVAKAAPVLTIRT